MTQPKIHIPQQYRQYLFKEILGAGSFSTVCKVLNTKNQQTYACKVFPRSNLTDPGDQNRFQREINAMAFIRHENLITLHDFFWDEHNFYLVMDLCSGGELFEYMIEHGKFDEPTAALIFRQFASAVSCCHSFGVCHRDLKPENILFHQFPRVKVSDFGLCGYLTNEIMMQTFCGSPCYCSPECICKVPYDGRLADNWALGMTFYYAFFGEFPFTISDKIVINVSIMTKNLRRHSLTFPDFTFQCSDSGQQQEVKRLLSGLLEKDPSNRMPLEECLASDLFKGIPKSSV